MGHRDRAESYAKALFDLAEDQSIQSQTADSLEQIAELIKVMPEFRKLLCGPVFPKQQKKDLLFELLKPFNAPYFLSLIDLLIERGDIADLSEIALCYRRLFYEKHGILKVDLETALPLSVPFLNEVKKNIEKQVGKEVVIDEKVLPSLIGGMRLSLHNRSINDSIKDKLLNLKSLLSSQISKKVRS